MAPSVMSALILLPFLSVTLHESGTRNALLGPWLNNTKNHTIAGYIYLWCSTVLYRFSCLFIVLQVICAPWVSIVRWVAQMVLTVPRGRTSTQQEAQTWQTVIPVYRDIIVLVMGTQQHQGCVLWDSIVLQEWTLRHLESTPVLKVNK